MTVCHMYIDFRQMTRNNKNYLKQITMQQQNTYFKDKEI